MPYDKESYRGNRGGSQPFRKDQPPRVGAVNRGVPRAVRDDGPEKPRSARPFGDRRPENGRFNRDFDGRRPENNHFNRGNEDRRPENGHFNRDFEGRRPEKPAFERKYDNRRPERPAYDRLPQPERHSYAEPKPFAPRPAAPRPIEPKPAAFRPAPAESEELTENLLVGRNPIREAIKAGREIEKLLVARGDLSGSAREIVAKAKEARIVVQEVDKARLDAIYPNHQGMLAYVSAAHYAELDDIFDCAAERNEEPFVIVLDGVTDPHNLGAVIRTAECVGAHGVIIPERRSVGLTPAAVKASAGACEYMNVVRVVNINRTLEQLKERGLWIVGTTMDGENAFDADLTGPVALVIGAEGEGISELTLKKCDLKLRLPMKGHLDSLNASVAAGVMMYAVVNARRG